MYNGVNLDVGMTSGGNPTRSQPDSATMNEELRVISEDLHADCVRITGDRPDVIAEATRLAHSHGLEVWFSPFYADLDRESLLSRFEECARHAESARASGPTVLVLGCELTVHCLGFVLGDDLFNRFSALRQANDREKGVMTLRLNEFLGDAVSRVRHHFRGDITYAAGNWEDVDWTPFDRVSVNLYRTVSNSSCYSSLLEDLKQWEMPTAITEYGCCTYRGASDRGPAGWLAFDSTSSEFGPKSGLERSEEEQAAYLEEAWAAQKRAGIVHSFWFTYSSYWCPHRPTVPSRDLDLLSFGLVTTPDPELEEILPFKKKVAFRVAARLWGKEHAGGRNVH